MLKQRYPSHKTFSSSLASSSSGLKETALGRGWCEKRTDRLWLHALWQFINIWQEYRSIYASVSNFRRRDQFSQKYSLCSNPSLKGWSDFMSKFKLSYSGGAYLSKQLGWHVGDLSYFLCEFVKLSWGRAPLFPSVKLGRYLFSVSAYWHQDKAFRSTVCWAVPILTTTPMAGLSLTSGGGDRSVLNELEINRKILH